jgi:hypothetical protein
MSTPSPFEVGRQIGNNFGAVRRDAADQGALDQILTQAMNSNDPSQLQNSIGQILSKVSPQRQPQAIQYLQSKIQGIEKQHQQRSAFQEQMRQEEIKRKGAENAGVSFGVDSSVQAQQLRNQTPKAPPGGISAQPVPPEITEKLTEIVQSSPNATADELAIKFDQSGIPRAHSNSYIESRRRTDETKEKNRVKQEEASRSEVLQFHKESEKFDTDLMHQGRIARKQKGTIKDIAKALQSGNIKTSSLANIFKGLGRVGDKFAEAMQNPDQAVLAASIPQLLEGWKDVFGVRLSDADLRVLQDKLPSIGKDVETNFAILGVLDKYADQAQLRSDIAAQIKKDNNNLRPLGFASLVDEKFNDMMEPVSIVYEVDGQPRVIEIPAFQLPEAIKSGAKLANGDQM